MARGHSLAGRVRVLIGAVGFVLVLVIGLLGLSVAEFRDDVNARDGFIPAAGDAADLSGGLVQRFQAGGAGDPTQTQQAFVLLGRLERELAAESELFEQLTDLRAELTSWQAAVAVNASPDVQQVLLNDLVDRSEALTRAITDATEDAAGMADTSRTRLLWSIAIAAVAALLLLAVGATALRQWFILPVHGLVQDISRVADGDYDHELRVDGSRELAQLADSVARMRDRILSEHDRAVRATEAVDQEAPAMVALRTLLEPRLSPPPPGFTVAGGLLPAEGELAGDWYDIGERDGAVVVALGDVCGHGVDAGVLAVRTKFALLDAMTLGLDPASALDLAARRFARDDTFVTAIYIEVDGASGVCRYASAGHNPALIVRADGGLEQLARTGPLIGLVDGPRPTAEVPIGPGDLLVLYTDGVVEARDDTGAQLLMEGLEALLDEHREAEPDRVVEAIIGSVLAHCGGRCSDDATVVVVRVDA